MKTMKKFYFIEYNYVGPNRDYPHLNYDYVAISTRMPETGTTNDVSCYAHGEYNALVDAQVALEDKFPETRRDYRSLDDGEIERYLVGEYERMPEPETAEWVYEDMKENILATTTDAEIDAFVADREENAREEHEIDLFNLYYIVKEFRDGLRND